MVVGSEDIEEDKEKDKDEDKDEDKQPVASSVICANSSMRVSTWLNMILSTSCIPEISKELEAAIEENNNIMY